MRHLPATIIVLAVVTVSTLVAEDDVARLAPLPVVPTMVDPQLIVAQIHIDGASKERTQALADLAVLESILDTSRHPDIFDSQEGLSHGQQTADPDAARRTR